MAEMTKKQRVRAALAGEPVDHVPVSLWGHDFLREWSPQDLAAATVQAYRAGDWDFIKFNPRATYFAEAWGNTYERPTEQRQPRLTSTAVQSAEQLADVRPVDAESGVFGEHLVAMRMVMDETKGHVDVVQTVFTPLSVAAILCGPSPATFIEHARARADDAHAAIAAVAETLAAYAGACVAAGASGIFFAPLMWASRDTCSPEFYSTFGRPYDMRVLDAVRGADVNILHVCRNHNMLDVLLDYPVGAFNWADRGEGNPSLGEIKSRTDKAVMGGLDQTKLHEMTPDEATAQARQALAIGPERLFLTAGCAIAPSTPAVVRAAVAAAARGA